MLRCAVFGVHAVVSISYELDIITNLGFLSFFFDDSIIEYYQRVWVDVIKIVAGCLTRDFSLEELVILPDLCLDAVIDTYPVVGILDFPSVGSLAAAASRLRTLTSYILSASGSSPASFAMVARVRRLGR